jgi:hypothetical protein
VSGVRERGNASMKPHPRIRKTIKWGGAAVTVLLVVVWFGSGWRGVRWRNPRWDLSIYEGRFRVYRAPAQYVQPADPTKFQWPLYCHGWKWNTNWVVIRDLWSIDLPLVWPTTAVFALTSIAWIIDVRVQRRTRLNLCQRCGYDLAGLLSDANCPECGVLRNGSPTQ